MFLPLGLLAGLMLRSMWSVVLLSLILAAGIEAIQLLVPGRDPSLGDVFFNVAGGASGTVVPRVVMRSLRAGYPGAARLSLLAAVVVVALHSFTAWALGPELPHGRYFSFWGPDLGHLAPTDARLRQVTLAGRPIPEGWVGESDVVRRRLSDGRPLAISLEPGTAPAGLGGLYALYDDRQNEILLVGRLGEELVLRVHRRSTRLRLDVPDIRVQDFFAGTHGGDSLTIRVERDASRRGAYCATRSRDSHPEGDSGSFAGGSRAACNLGLTLGRGWALLGYPDALPIPLRTLLDIAWVCLFFVPIGLWARARWETVLGLGLAVTSLLAAPVVSSLLPTPPYLYAAAAAGLCAGLPPVRRRLLGWSSGGR